MASLLSTCNVEEKDRFAYWREAVCESYVMLDCQCDRPETFQGEILLNRMSRLSTSFVTGSQQLVRRRRKDVARETEESFLISLQLAQQGTISQCGRSAVLRPGDFTLYSSTDRYSIDLQEGFRQLVVQIPREDLLGRLPKADLLTGITVSGTSAIGRIAGQSALRLVDTIDSTGPAVHQYLQNTIVDLFVTGLASVQEMKFELSLPEQQILLRADAIIHAHLKDPEFDRQALAQAMGLSVRRLTEIFQIDDRSISSTIRDMRLQNIAEDLSNPQFTRLSIREIALKWGISNHQSLIRNFKARYGMTPSAYRLRC